jgi:hypothetical protein
LCRLRVWGRPVYVLDPRLQDGKKLPKWYPRSRRGMFLGFSTQHSSTVLCILNLVTRHISPQYHVIYDELFSTVTTTQLQLEALSNNSVFALEQWNELIVSGYERSEVLVEVEQEGLPLPQLENEWLSPAEIEEHENLRVRRAAQRRLARSEVTQERIPENTDMDRQINAGPIVQPVPVTVQVPQNKEPERQEMQPAQPVPDEENTRTVQPEPRAEPQPTVRTGGRRIQANQRFIGKNGVITKRAAQIIKRSKRLSQVF